tara:strand:- start:608 stop:799 length:192 start_codon:yes stop_codon:yes gene_type:complete
MRQVAFQCSEEFIEMIDEMAGAVKKLQPDLITVKRSDILRLAVRKGLRAIEKEAVRQEAGYVK